MALVLVAGSNPRCCWPNSSAPSPNQGGSSRRGDAMSEAGKRLLDLPNCRPETHARHGGDHSMLCFIGAVPGLITMKEWERLDREREIAEAVAAHEATLRERGWMDEWEVETATAMNYGDGQAAERARIVARVETMPTARIISQW